MSGNINFNGWLNDDGSENYKCRAWVNFNGEGTVAIRASGNVSSITDVGVGDYTANFTTAMPDVNYTTLAATTTYSGSARNFSFGPANNDNYPRTTTTVRLRCEQSDGVAADLPNFEVAIFR